MANFIDYAAESTGYSALTAVDRCTARLFHAPVDLQVTRQVTREGRWLTLDVILMYRWRVILSVRVGRPSVAAAGDPEVMPEL